MTTLDVTYWVRLLAILAGEVACVIAVVLVAQCFARSGVWRRSLWRVGVGCLLVVMGAELTGLGRGLASWAKREPPAVREVKIATTVKMLDYTPPATVTAETTPPMPDYSPMPKKAVAAKTLWIPCWLWLTGFILVMGRMMVARVFMGWLRWRRREIRGTDLNTRVGKILQQMRARCGVRLWSAPGLVCPVAFGIVRPTIVLPEKFEQRFTQEQQDVMLTHELAHLVARDPLWYWLADLACALLWWHPIVWWARRQLHNNSELAADEATAILPDGPNTLAECLVGLGKELSGLRNWGWMGVGGNGFRSSLGKRVERLIKLEESLQIKPEGWKVFSGKLAGGIFLTALVVIGAGWAQSESQSKSENWGSTLRESWNSSPASVVLLAALEQKTTVAPSVVETPKIKDNPVEAPSDTKVNQPSEPKPEGRSPGTVSNGIADEKVDLIAFDNTSLGEALHVLMQQAASSAYSSCANRFLICDSPELEKDSVTFRAEHLTVCDQALLDWIVKASKVPIEYTAYPGGLVFSAKNADANGMVNREYYMDEPLRMTLQHTGPDEAGASFDLVKPFYALASQAGVDLQQVGRTCFYSERKKRLLVRTTLREQAVIKHLLEKGLPAGLAQKADLKKESKLDQAAVAPVKVADPAAMPPTNETNLYSRTFRVDPKIFSEALDKMGGLSPGGTNRTVLRNTIVWNYFKAAGVNFDIQGKMVFFNDRNGSLFVRATLKDLESIGMAVEVLNAVPQQLTIEARFCEMDAGKAKVSGMDGLMDTPFRVPVDGVDEAFGHLKRVSIAPPNKATTNDSGDTRSSILTPSKFRVVERALEQRSDVEMVSVPKTTTFSGRQIHASTLEWIMARTNSDPSVPPAAVQVGMAIDAIPEVSVDGYSMRLTVIASVTQLLDQAGAKWQSSSSKIAVPKTWQLFTSCNIWDGQTLVLSDLMPEGKSGPGKKLFVFVTPQMADPRGYPTHVNENLEFIETTIPAQRTAEK